MQYQELLLTTAEVSAAFAGFSGVVGVFGKSNREIATQFQVYRLTQMITTSLSALAFSILPFLITAFGFPELMLWRIASAVYVPFAAIFTTLGIYQGRAFVQAGLASSRSAQIIALEQGLCVYLF